MARILQLCWPMAYRLRPHESVEDGLRRLVQKELHGVCDRLRKARRPSDKVIHEARKSIKKVRAIARLFRADGGHGWRKSWKQLRKVNGVLSRLRDAAATLEVLATLREQFPEIIDGRIFGRIRRVLVSAKRRMLGTANADGSWQGIERNCQRLQKSTKRWRLEHRQFDALAPGIRKEYRRGRAALAAVRAHQSAESFHTWRKRIKALWYELRLIEEYRPDVSRDVERLHTTQQWLGDDHNAVVLCEQLNRVSSQTDAQRLQRAAALYEQRLRRQALATGARIFARRPKAVVRDAALAWRASQ